MAIVNGTLTDFGLDPLTINSPRLIFRASSTGIAGLNLLSQRKAVEVIPAANGYFEANLVSTYLIAPETTHYTIEINYRETESGLRVSEVLPWKLLVPPEGGNLGDLLQVAANPALVWTGTVPPLNPSPGTWWLDPDTGDLAEWTQDGTTWAYKANLKGPAGYNATGLAEDDAAIAALINESNGTPTAVGNAMRARQVRRRAYDPMDYGAVGDGIADDTAKVQAAIDAAPEGAEIRISRRHRISAVTLNKRYITVTGPGTLYNGKLVIGTTGARQDLFITIKGVTFEQSSRAAGTYHVELLKARRVKMINCSFIGADKSIYVNPLADAIMHDTGMIVIDDNEFSGCNYALYVDRADAVTWMHFSDSHFTNNTVNLGYISHIWIKSVDGMHITGNTFFFPAYNTSDATLKANKKNNIYMGQANFFVIADNNLFEAGEEAILLDQPSRFTIHNNNIAWPGQKQPSDGIKLTGANTLNGIISDNVISKPTKDGISVYANGTGTVSIKDNAIEYDAATGTYYGSTALNSFTHYGIYQDPASANVNMLEMGNDMTGGLYTNRKGSIISSVRLNNDTGISSSKASKTFTAATAQPVLKVNSQRFGQLTAAGLIEIHAKASDTENSNLASYILHVSKSNVYAIAQISALGLTTGGSANWPSFTWSINAATGDITATPVGSTAGTFFFYSTAIGNLRLVASS